MTLPVVDWTPPVGMLQPVISSWRAFYRAAFAKYGITPAEYRALYLAQLGRCYICQKARGIHPDDPKGCGGRRLGIDHNHLGVGRSMVRGLLCTGGGPGSKVPGCNWVIGVLTHDALQRAVTYVQEWPAQGVLNYLGERGEVADDELTGLAYR